MTTKRKSIQTITDPLLEPFFITKDEYSYTVKQNVTSDASHFRAKGKAKTYEKSLYYYAKLIAEGTATSPIVFTSDKAVGARTKGDWGGIILFENTSQHPF